MDTKFIPAIEVLSFSAAPCEVLELLFLNIIGSENSFNDQFVAVMLPAIANCYA